MGTGQGARSRGLDGLAFVLMTAFAASLYVSPTEWIPAVARLRLVMVASVLATGLVLLRGLSRDGGRLDLDGARGLAAAGLGLLALASIRWSVYPEASRFAAGEVLKLVATYLTLVAVVTTPRRLAVIAGAMVLGSLVTSVGVIHWYRAGVDLVEGFRARWIGSYADPNRMAMSLEIIIPIAVAFLTRRALPLAMRAVALVAAALALVCIVISFSRGGFIGLALGMATWAVLERKKVQLAVVGLVFGGMLAFAPSSYWNRAETVTSFHEDASAMGRVHAWEVAANINRDRPLLGTGAGSFPYAWPLYAPPGVGRSYAAHNIFIQVIAEYGMVGFLLLLVFIGAATGGVFSVKDDPDHGWLARGLAAALTGYLACNLFSGFLISPHLWVLLALAAAAQRALRTRHVLALEAPVDPRARGPAVCTEAAALVPQRTGIARR